MNILGKRHQGRSGGLRGGEKSVEGVYKTCQGGTMGLGEGAGSQIGNPSRATSPGGPYPPSPGQGKPRRALPGLAPMVSSGLKGIVCQWRPAAQATTWAPPWSPRLLGDPM